jgi:hypothetical protein
MQQLFIIEKNIFKHNLRNSKYYYFIFIINRYIIFTIS